MDVDDIEENELTARETELLERIVVNRSHGVEPNVSSKETVLHALPSGFALDVTAVGNNEDDQRLVCGPLSASGNSLLDTTLISDLAQNDTLNKEKQTKKNPLYAEIKEPVFYDVRGNLVTKPVIFKNLAEQFNSLPIYGRPKHKKDLPQFFHNKIREFVGYDVDDNEFDKLAKYCSPDHLKIGHEVQMFTNFPTYGPFPSVEKLNEKRVIEKAAEISNEVKLNLIKRLQLRIENDKGNYYCKRLKYRGIRMMPLFAMDEDNDNPTVTIGKPLEPGKDLLFRVRIYRPHSQNWKYERCRLRAAVFNCDVVMLGRQRLSVLRDRIACTNDVGMRTDVAHCPDQPSVANAKTVFPSGFLFINNVFYVDRRANCRDTSAVVRDWAERRGLGTFPCRDMGAVRLEDLVLRLGHPEVYVHQGNCEHLFTLSEVRTLGARDALRPALYPAHTAAGSCQAVYCTTCAEFGAKWVVRHCPRVPFDPAFFCDTCLRLYLYRGRPRRPVGRFQAYHYRGNELNMLKPQG